MPLLAEVAAEEKAELLRLIERNNDQIMQMTQTLEALEKSTRN